MHVASRQIPSHLFSFLLHNGLGLLTVKFKNESAMHCVKTKVFSLFLYDLCLCFHYFCMMVRDLQGCHLCCICVLQEVCSTLLSM